MPGRRASYRSSITGKEETFDRLEKIAWTRWINSHVSKRGMDVDNLFLDLRDGVVLINLVEVVTNSRLPRYAENPKGQFQCQTNITILLDWLNKKKGLNFKIDNEALAQGDPNFIMDFMWTLFRKLDQSEMESKQDEGLSDKETEEQWSRQSMDWLNAHTAQFAPEIPQVTNWTSDFNDGKVLCGLCAALKPGLFGETNDFSFLGEEKEADCQLALLLAEEHFRIKPLFSAEDFISRPDKRSTMAYISLFKVFEKSRNKALNKMPCAEKCSVSGSGVKRGEVGEMMLFVIYIRDDENYLMDVQEDRLAVEITSTAVDHVDVVLMNNKDGTYSCAWMGDVEGEYSVSVLVNNEQIEGSPYAAKIVAQGRPIQLPPAKGTTSEQFVADDGEYEECMLEIIDRNKEFYGWISEKGTCYNKHGEIVGYVWGNACGGSESEFWGQVESDIVYNVIDTRIGKIQMDRGWLRDGSDRTIAEFERNGSFVGNSGVFSGQFIGFSYHQMDVVSLYLLLVDSTLLNEYDEMR